MAIKRKDCNNISVNYHLVTEKITPFETIKIDNHNQFHFKNKILKIMKSEFRIKSELKKAKSWILGLRNLKEYAFEIIREIIRSLKILNWRWYKVSFFHIVLNLSCSVCWPFFISSIFKTACFNKPKNRNTIICHRCNFYPRFHKSKWRCYFFF